MTAAAPGTQRSRTGPEGNPLLIGVLVIGVLIFAAAFLSGGPAAFHRSALGFEGLVAWLRHNGLEARGFGGGGMLTEENVGLRILPLFHAEPSPRAGPDTPAKLQPTPSPVAKVPPEVIQKKIALLPTLVVLPKWTTEVLRNRLAHPLMLLPRDGLNELLQGIDASAGQVGRREHGYVEHRVTFGGKDFLTGLYYPQTVRGGDCEPILGERDAMLFGKCDADRTAYYLLADPDLMNAHGLRLAENARLVVALVETLAEGRPVIVDRTDAIFASEWFGPDREIRPRTWTDLVRFFAYPFSLLWAGFAVVGTLVLWRAWVRYGPALHPFDDAPGASKDVSIAATARLLRTAGYDAKLLSTYVATRCQALAAELMGPHRPAGTDPRILVAAATRRKSPELANAFETTTRAVDALGPSTALDDLLDLLDRFEGLYQRILHEFGRTPGTRRRNSG